MKMIQRFGAALAMLLMVATSFASAATQDTPAKKKIVAQESASKKPVSRFSYKGYVRSYYFTRQNASATQKGPNQAAWNTGISLHGEYNAGGGFTLGATYFYANPLNGNCSQAANYQPSAGNACLPAPPGIAADNTLPDFQMSTLYEAYVKYQGHGFGATLGNQVFNSPWANSSDSRLKPVAFQGGDVTYKLNKNWNLEGAVFSKFEGRAQSAFDNSTLLTGYYVDAPSLVSEGNIFNPNGKPNAMTNSGFGYAKVGYAAKGLAADLYYYGFNNIATLTWFDAKYSIPGFMAKYKPFIALQAGSEQDTGNALIGKIRATGYGLQAGLSVTKNVDFTVGYNNVPAKSDTVVLPAGVSCSAAHGLYGEGTSAATNVPYFLAANPFNCVSNGAAGTTTLYYGGFASPYTDSYATDPFFTTSMTQGMVDRRTYGQGVKFALMFNSTNKRFHAILSRALYADGTAAVGVTPTQETDVDAFYYVSKVGKGAYHGWLVRYRYGERTEQFGGLPLFKYNRAQVEYDF